MPIMFHGVTGSGPALQRRPAPARLLAVASAASLFAIALPALQVHAQRRVPYERAPEQRAAVRRSGLPHLTPVHFWTAGRTIPLKNSAVWNGRDTYVPLSALPAIGAHGTLTAQRNRVSVRLRSGRTDVLPFVRRDGIVLISLTDLAESANASIIRPSATPAAGLRPDTAYLLAHVTDVHLQGHELHVTTSFPVPFVSNTVVGNTGRGYIDCIGATATRDFKPFRLAATERRAERIRIGQFTPNVARIAVDLAPGIAIERSSTEGRVTPTFAVLLDAGRAPTRVARASRRTAVEGEGGLLAPSTHRTNGSRTTMQETDAESRPASPHRRPVDSTDTATPRRRSSDTADSETPRRRSADSETPRKRSSDTTGSEAPRRRSSDTADSETPRKRAADSTDAETPRRHASDSADLETSRPRSTDSTDSQTPRRRPTDPVQSTRTNRSPASAARTADIRSIAYESQDNQSIQIIIETSRKARAYVRYSATSRQMIVDIPNSRLNLADDRQKEQDIQHPLIEGLTAATVQSSPRLPPLTRITIDAPRIVSTSIETDNNQIVLDITVPKSGRNNPARPGGGARAIVVVDAGHGGALTGAKARVHNRNVYEKNVALSIASKLRTQLRAHGARVVMTRTTDINVPLQERPRVANEAGADIFISIHNDSWGKANTITGTTAYYHANSPGSRRLARCVERQIASVSGLRDRGAVSDTTLFPVGFCVLRETTMPAILCEVGYLNNTRDRARLLNTAYQQRVAEAVCHGVQNYLTSEQKTARRHGKRQASPA